MRNHADPARFERQESPGPDFASNPPGPICCRSPLDDQRRFGPVTDATRTGTQPASSPPAGLPPDRYSSVVYSDVASCQPPLAFEYRFVTRNL